MKKTFVVFGKSHMFLYKFYIYPNISKYQLHTRYIPVLTTHV